ncbi:unnamed protein product [Owenia fusiformis]|uniref:Uncharacterized protein n=1 Tax=Owenia fusiformis TaxID=6347 RepID=A0A8J1TA86_OWEFU|nr:unnamed protein product [Owenia fusiformis]
MGQSGSSMVKKMVSPISNMFGYNTGETSPELVLSRYGTATPFVYKRTSSMYFDEDGDLAHEFYEEVLDRRSRRYRMKKKKHNLIPEGEIELAIPRLNCNLPIVLCEAPVSVR